MYRDHTSQICIGINHTQSKNNALPSFSIQAILRTSLGDNWRNGMLNAINASKGFLSGLRYSASGRKNTFYYRSDWGKERTAWQAGELAGMFTLTALEVGMTGWGVYSLLCHPFSSLPLYMKVVTTSSTLYLAYQSLVGSKRCISEVSSVRGLSKLVRNIHQKNSL
jgi:hypothetical protein